jgi:ubiquinol-cytochrome c reductase cytochrome b subunit
MKLMPVLRRAGGAADDRFRIAKAARTQLRKLFPDHWSFLLGELALYSFVILLLTGTFLTLFFKPSMSDLIYHGSYVKLDGVHMSEAYASTLQISFDVRGGLLIRQIHHWAALVFLGAIVTHMLRIFFSGAFRRPREVNWVIGTTLFVLAAVEGFCGYSLPDDLLSGTGLRTAEGIMLSIPVVGTYLVYFLFGGQYPGTDIIPRLYITHVLIIPGLLLALISAHLLIIWHQEHTEWPGGKRREHKTVGVPLYPLFMAKTGALFFFVFSVLALLATVTEINPIWLYGPYNPALQSSFSQPDWYFGFVEGALRLMPGVVSNVGGHTFAWNVFVPGALLPALFFFIMYLYPFVERYATGDTRYHHILDRPRNVPTRTGIGIAVVVAGTVLLLAGGDDLIAYRFDIPVFLLVDLLRAGFFVLPVLSFFAARYACLALQRRDARRLAAGIPTGVIEELPGGGYAERTQPVPEGLRAELETRRPDSIMLPIPRHIIPLPTPRRVHAQVRARLNHFYTRYWVETPSGDGQQGRYDKRVAQREAEGQDSEG